MKYKLKYTVYYARPIQIVKSRRIRPFRFAIFVSILFVIVMAGNGNQRKSKVRVELIYSLAETVPVCSSQNRFFANIDCVCLVIRAPVKTVGCNCKWVQVKVTLDIEGSHW